MYDERIRETKLRQQQDMGTRAGESTRCSGHLAWKIVGGVALALAATAIITSMNDIRRYIRIVRM